MLRLHMGQLLTAGPQDWGENGWAGSTRMGCWGPKDGDMGLHATGAGVLLSMGTRSTCLSQQDAGWWAGPQSHI